VVVEDDLVLDLVEVDIVGRNAVVLLVLLRLGVVHVLDLGLLGAAVGLFLVVLLFVGQGLLGGDKFDLF